MQKVLIVHFWGSAIVNSSPTDSEVTLNILVSSSTDPATAYPTLYINPADSGVVTMVLN